MICARIISDFGNGTLSRLTPCPVTGPHRRSVGPREGGVCRNGIRWHPPIARVLTTLGSDMPYMGSTGWLRPLPARTEPEECDSHSVATNMHVYPSPLSFDRAVDKGSLFYNHVTGLHGCVTWHSRCVAVFEAKVLVGFLPSLPPSSLPEGR